MPYEIWVYRLYDVAQEIDLSQIEAMLLRDHPMRRMRLSKVRSKALSFKNPPLTFQLPASSVSLQGHEIPVQVSGKLYDFGVLSISMRLLIRDASYDEMLDSLAASGYRQDMERPQQVMPSEHSKTTVEADTHPTMSASMEVYNRLRQYASELMLDEPDRLDEVFERYRDELIARVRPALSGGAYEGYIEDFVIYVFDRWPSDWDPVPILLGEMGTVSEAMRREALRHTYSYSDDAVMVTWDSAIVSDPDGANDVADLLEFAKAQLLELRYYDDLLDGELTQLYTALEGAPKGLTSGSVLFGRGRSRRTRELMRRMMELIVEITEFTGRIENALKVTHDYYYVRIYTGAQTLFRMKEWSESIGHKMDVLSQHYQLLSDESTSQRFIWIDTLILLLIAIEIIIWLYTLK